MSTGSQVQVNALTQRLNSPSQNDITLLYRQPPQPRDSEDLFNEIGKTTDATDDFYVDRLGRLVNNFSLQLLCRALRDLDVKVEPHQLQNTEILADLLLGKITEGSHARYPRLYEIFSYYQKMSHHLSINSGNRKIWLRDSIRYLGDDMPEYHLHCDKQKRYLN